MQRLNAASDIKFTAGGNEFQTLTTRPEKFLRKLMEHKFLYNLYLWPCVFFAAEKVICVNMFQSKDNFVAIYHQNVNATSQV